MALTTQSVLLGRDHHRSRQFLIFAVAICLAFTIVLTISGVVSFTFDWYAEDLRAMFLYGIGAIALVGAILNAYLNSGLLVSTVVTFVLALGYGVSTILLTGAGMFVSDSPPLLLFIYFAGGSIGVGIAAFVVGTSIRKLSALLGV